jgi:hypothetical protein
VVWRKLRWRIACGSEVGIRVVRTIGRLMARHICYILNRATLAISKVSVADNKEAYLELWLGYSHMGLTYGVHSSMAHISPTWQVAKLQCCSLELVQVFVAALRPVMGYMTLSIKNSVLLIFESRMTSAFPGAGRGNASRDLLAALGSENNRG